MDERAARHRMFRCLAFATSSSACRPTAPHSSCCSCFLPRSLMEEFAQHTNAAAPHDWRPTTAAELYAFLGVHLFMGI